jgi:hypothetical protein
MGILVRRTPAWAAWLSVAFGISTTVFLFNIVPTAFMGDILRPIVGDWFYTYLQTNKFTFTNLITVPATSLFFLSTRLFYKRVAESEDKQAYVRDLDEFTHRIKTPVDFESEVGGDNTPYQAFIIGTLCMVYGGVVSLGIFIPNPMPGRLVILGCAGFMFTIGFSLYLYGRIKHPRKKVVA